MHIFIKYFLFLSFAFQPNAVYILRFFFFSLSKFWTRNRPGDRMRDKYNLNTLPKGQEDAADYGMYN